MKVKYSYSINLAGATINDSFTVDESDFEGKTQEEIDKEIDEMVWDSIAQNIDWCWEVEE